MARLVARAMRLGRSAVIQTGNTSEKYALSYLTPALLYNSPVIIVVELARQEILLNREIPELQKALKTNKEIFNIDSLSNNYLKKDCSGLILTTPELWLEDRLNNFGKFPSLIPTIFDRGDDLEDLIREILSLTLKIQDWQELTQTFPEHLEIIGDLRVALTKAIFSHPKNPYECWLLDEKELKIFQELCQTLSDTKSLTPKFDQFARFCQQETEFLIWTSLKRARGEFHLHATPMVISSLLKSIWQQQPVVIIGSILDATPGAILYRQQLGLPDLLYLEFSPNRQNESLQIYAPARIPLPNTPQFEKVLLEQIHLLVNIRDRNAQPIVILIDDTPLKGKIGAILAAEFGSRVRVETTDLPNKGILVSGWQFWRSHQQCFSLPQLLIVATLPIPSLENPLVAGRVNYHKRKKQDWFRLYLLPTALKEMQKAVLPLRESQGIVALLDNRVNHRSYGNKIFAALEPCVKINYIDPSWSI
jgi:ATP-dependent DNA helicase DinG